MSEIDCVDLEYLKELSGCRQKKPLINWLNKQGYKFCIREDGWPKVTKGYISYRLGPDTFQDNSKRKRGNKAALHAAMGIHP